MRNRPPPDTNNGADLFAAMMAADNGAEFMQQLTGPQHAAVDAHQQAVRQQKTEAVAAAVAVEMEAKGFAARHHLTRKHFLRNGGVTQCVWNGGTVV
jgi:hypothetical protein